MNRYSFVALMALACPLQADSFWQKVAWSTPDGVQMVGLYHPAEGASALTWVLLHGLGSNKEEWEAFGRKLAGQGSGVFIYDARGHNESVHLKSGGDITYRSWPRGGPGTPWDAMPSDLETAVQQVRKKFGLSSGKIAVGGASLGANVALVYASRHAEVPSLLLLSPGMDYAGIGIEEAWKRYGQRKALLAASPQDAYAYASVRQLAASRGDALLRVAEGPGSAHGVNMFQDPALTKKILDWMKE